MMSSSEQGVTAAQPPQKPRFLHVLPWGLRSYGEIGLQRDRLEPGPSKTRVSRSLWVVRGGLSSLEMKSSSEQGVMAEPDFSMFAHRGSDLIGK